jgi:hypothetical protein
MKTKQNDDKIIRITSFLVVIIVFLFAFLLLHISSIKTQPIANDTVFVTQCGFLKDNFLRLFNGNLVHSRLFSYPYNAVGINLDDYFLLKDGNRSRPVFYQQKPLTENYRQYYIKIIFTGNQSVYYSAILKEFQKTKSVYNLDDDEYLQLIVNFVQAMPYFTEKSEVKYPLVTFTDGCGDCDDKSLLLLALLSQENYNVSIFIIPPDGPNLPSHAMAGVASNSATFTKNGYAMIETTKKDSAIGRFPSNVASEKVLVIRIGNGTKTFETHSSIWVVDASMFKVIKKGNKTVSITPYYQDFDILDFFREQNENINWKKDCENGKIPFIVCYSESH